MELVWNDLVLVSSKIVITSSYVEVVEKTVIAKKRARFTLSLSKILFCTSPFYLSPLSISVLFLSFFLPLSLYLSQILSSSLPLSLYLSIFSLAISLFQSPLFNSILFLSFYLSLSLSLSFSLYISTPPSLSLHNT